MRRLRGRRWRWSLLVAAILVLAGALYLMQRPERIAANQLALARARWEARPFQNYHLTVRELIGNSSCHSELDVQDEQAGQIVVNTCTNSSGWTVSRLLDWVAELERTSTNCYPGPAACACLTTPLIGVTFDAQSGYPTTIRYDWGIVSNYSHPDYWRIMWLNHDFPSCNRQRFGGSMQVSIELTPQP